MTCLERIECIKAATPTVVTLLIAACCAIGTGAILLGHLPEFAGYLDKLIGTLLIIAGMQNEYK
jgi:hypothetical protein